ncbi:exopolyphosphatase [Sphingobium sp. TA15]|uniref:Exopolyphosphatase n=3 Tax=Sphingobium indicum TaxID=332055 RepID=D4Z554_SPHIU|nr:Ppx/GppA family phosphatase [Sphingobium indicum]APL93108.1 exopolyphosphatase [Sphingobium indicum B90A]KER37186.1 exopolyphosphatase [Sphingobium indicum F2]BAI97736.1 exopolyphosphatase [Sphingobium indicum UT26S]BDD67140.1 exopolyphosphatase [Sphingobium sp. TA15]
MNSMLSQVRAIAPGMATSPQQAKARTAIIDIGSNSVRLVVYDGPRRIPFILFNEKVMAGLGASLGRTGRIEPEAMERGLRAAGRFAHLCREMEVQEVRCVATAAVRDAENGDEFIRRAREMGLEVELLTGGQEAVAAAHGVLSGIPGADGIVGDLGGGSLELARIRDGAVHETISLPLGVLRLPQIRAKGPAVLERMVRKMLAKAGWDAPADLPFYLVGGSWRALARFDMELTRFPLPVVHQYEMPATRAEQLTRIVSHVGKARFKDIPQITGSRVPTLPDAAALLSVIVRQLKSSRLVVSAYGLREGLLFGDLPPDIRAHDPLLVAAEAEGEAQARFTGHGDMIERWIAPLFLDDGDAWRRIRRAACLLADVGWRANPDFRSERGVEIALHSNWVGINAAERAMLAQALHSNFGGGLSTPPGIERLAPPEALRRATLWGLAIRLGQRLSGGVEGPLLASRLGMEGNVLELRLRSVDADLFGEAVERRQRQLAQAMGVKHRLAW